MHCAKRSRQGCRRNSPHHDIASGRVLKGGDPAAANRARRDPCVVKRLDPCPPIGPPRARMLFNVLEPRFEFPLRRGARPILVAIARRGIDNARDVSRACKYEFDPAAETARANKDRARRGNMEASLYLGRREGDKLLHAGKARSGYTE